MMTKTFDCVEMMHRAATRIRSTTKDMSESEELSYWDKRREELLPATARSRSKPLVAHEPRAPYRTGR